MRLFSIVLAPLIFLLVFQGLLSQMSERPAISNASLPTCTNITAVKNPVIEFGSSNHHSYLSTSIDSTGKLTINSPLFNHSSPLFLPRSVRLQPETVKAILASASSLGFFSMSSNESRQIQDGSGVSKYYTANPQKFIAINLPCIQHRVALNQGKESSEFNQLYALLKEVERIEPKVEGMEPNYPLGATGGPFIKEEAARASALKEAKARGLKSAQVRNIVLTTHGGLVQSKLFNPDSEIPLTDLREVYLITLIGDVMVSRTPGGRRFPLSDFMNVEIDATTGKFLNVGNNTW